jgi:hypothetical protein
MRRLFWATLGLGAGAALGIGAVRWASRTAERLAPASLGRRTLDAAAEWRVRLSEALEEGRTAMATREAELRARHAGPGNDAT